MSQPGKTDLNFIGRNIRFFRRSRNWTLLQLANRIDIREGPLGRIERGLNLPSATVIYRLSKAFGISVDALFSPELSQVQATIDNNDSFFVTIEPDPDPLPKNLLNACHEIMAAFHALEDICGVQKYAYLPLSIPFDPDYNGMDRLAARVRTYLGANDAVVFDYFELFENFGLRIIVFPFPGNAGDIASVSFHEPAFNNAFFFLNSRNNPEKQLFSLCLELGKILVFNEMRLRKAPVFPAAPQKAGKQEKTEVDRPINEIRAAKRFAATFLMPEKAVRSTVGQLGITPDTWSWELLVRIKHRFGVSTEAFLYRLDELDLINKSLRGNFQCRIKKFYNATNYAEPDDSRRCLTPNGRFFDLVLTAGTVKGAEKEVAAIKQLYERLKISYI
jgi:transcriptional regulator with XRE-family HTH domain/Zn-dependent peptidase ImmA (M78 family)